MPRPSRVLCERAGLLADIAVTDHWMRAKLLTSTRCPARFNVDRVFFPGGIVPGAAPRPIPGTCDQPESASVLGDCGPVVKSFAWLTNPVHC